MADENDPHRATMSRAELDALDAGLFARSLMSMGNTMSTANVIMQLADPAVGYGVARSTVENGRLDRHPVNGQHAQVRSTPDSPVEYNAMNPQLQLWVAACLYVGLEDIYERVYGPLAGDLRDEFYRQGMVCGTTLQIPAESWPADRDVFDEYWDRRVAEISISDEVREFLLSIARFGYAPRWVQRRYGPVKYRRTIGYLPPAFRTALRVDWTADDQRWFDGYIARCVAAERRLPRWRSQLGFRLLLWDTRIRHRLGRPLV